MDRGTESTVTDATVAKTVTMLVLGLGSLFLGVLPMKLASWCRHKKGLYVVSAPSAQDADHSHHHGMGDAAASSPTVSLLLCFGGGVLLFTTLLHLQPEVREGVIRLQRTGQLPTGNGTENLGDLIFCAGFFMVFFVEEIVHYVLDCCVGDGVDEEISLEECALRRSISLRQRAVPIPRVSLPGTDNETEQKDSPCGWPAVNQEKHAYSDPPPEQPQHQKRQHSFNGLFTVLALSFHEVFEGLAIGLEERADHVWYLFAAVAMHKLVIAFCIGLELAWSNTRRALLLLYVATFAIVTPVGIGIGISLIQLGGAGSTTDGIPGCTAIVLQGLAAGTLLYVVFFEVLARHKQSGFSHLLAIILGFVLLFLFQIATQRLNYGAVDEHDHHYGHSHKQHHLEQNDHHHDDMDKTLKL